MPNYGLLFIIWPKMECSHSPKDYIILCKDICLAHDNLQQQNFVGLNNSFCSLVNYSSLFIYLVYKLKKKIFPICN